MRYLLVAVFAVGCGGSGTKPTGPVTNSPAAAADVLAHLPADSTMVMSMDLGKLRASALWKQYGPRIEAAIAPQLAAAKQTCGFDPLAAVSSITVASGASIEADSTFVIRGLPREQTIACVMKQVIPQTTAQQDGDVIALHNQSGSLNMFAFVDAATVVMKGSRTPTKESVQAALGAGAPLRSAQPFMARFDKLDREAMWWIVLTGKGELLDRIAGAVGETPVGSDLTIRVSDQIEVEARIQLADEAAAKRTVEEWTTAAQALATFATIKATAERETVRLSVVVNRAAIDLLIEQYERQPGDAEEDPPPPEEEDLPDDGE